MSGAGVKATLGGLPGNEAASALQPSVGPWAEGQEKPLRIEPLRFSVTMETPWPRGTASRVKLGESYGACALAAATLDSLAGYCNLSSSLSTRPTLTSLESSVLPFSQLQSSDEALREQQPVRNPLSSGYETALEELITTSS